MDSDRLEIASSYQDCFLYSNIVRVWIINSVRTVFTSETRLRVVTGRVGWRSLFTCYWGQ